MPAASDATFLASSLLIAVMRCMAHCEEESEGLSFIMAENKFPNPGQSILSILESSELIRQTSVLPEKAGSLSLRESDIDLMMDAAGA